METQENLEHLYFFHVCLLVYILYEDLAEMIYLPGEVTPALLNLKHIIQPKKNKGVFVYQRQMWAV